MARILLLNPSRWGRGITPIWIASHSSILRANGHDVQLFDTTFYRDWAQNENTFNTLNQQYKPSQYENLVSYDKTPVIQALQSKINEYNPDIIFWSAISSHIHGEGEYVAIQYGHDLMRHIITSAQKICGGLQATASPDETLKRFPLIDYLIGGESEFVLTELISTLVNHTPIKLVKGVTWKNGDRIEVNDKQNIIADLDDIGAYDYNIFDDQVFLRAYNGEVVRAVDYELSRGCVFTCNYCVETVIQNYYGFNECTAKGALKNANKYLRHKSAKRIFSEVSSLYKKQGVSLFRCQDTNFLTINRTMLEELAGYFDDTDLPIKLYIETRPEGITPGSIKLLKRLKVDGVGMGIELATQSFRENHLNRYSNQEAIERAFVLLREAGIKRTAYNIIGIPDQTENSIIETIEFNQKIQPDNVTVAFFSPYLGTAQQQIGAQHDYFLDYEYDLDSQLRTMTRHSVLSTELLAFYKRYFVQLVKEGIDSLHQLKSTTGIC